MNDVDKCENLQNKSLPTLKLKYLDATWSKDATDNTLENINLDLRNNKLVAIIGPVGCGKSSLLNLFLKELTIKSGEMEIVGNMSYSSQEPWLFGESVRQNILFGNEYDEGRYQNIIEICSLRSDFAQFPFGDKTIVGEKGKSLSGGQKARINLARCVYKTADIYLLDDPLSAVDTKVGKQLYDKCIRGYLSDKICFLVTHQLQYLKDADHIVIMKKGRIQAQGAYNELINTGLDFARLLKEFASEDLESKHNELQIRQKSVLDDFEEEYDQNIEKEKIVSGEVTMQTYWTYLKAGGGKSAIFLATFLYVFCQIAANGGEYFVTFW